MRERKLVRTIWMHLPNAIRLAVQRTARIVDEHLPVPLSVACYVVFRGLFRWLWWCLPQFGFNTTGESYRFLAAHLNIIRGPYACFCCGRATTQGADTVRGVPAHCSRKACFQRAQP